MAVAGMEVVIMKGVGRSVVTVADGQKDRRNDDVHRRL